MNGEFLNQKTQTMKYLKISTLILAMMASITLYAQDNIFNGTSDNNWDNASNWSTGKVPPSHIVQKITIAADCEVHASNSTNYTFAAGSVFQINSGITFTNNGTGTWTMNGTYNKEGTYVGNLVINGSIEPGTNSSTWTCGDQLIYDAQSYATVSIGSQCWMAENLNIGTMINGNSNQANNNIIEKYCYNNNSSNCATYGGLYQWKEMMQYTTMESTQGVCPTGWHLPSDSEWMTLEEELGICSGTGSGCSGATGWRGSNEGSKMAGNVALWYSGPLVSDPEFGTSNLDILPAGYCDNHMFHYLNGGTYLWSSSENGSYAWYRDLGYGYTAVERNYVHKHYSFVVRCVKD